MLKISIYKPTAELIPAILLQSFSFKGLHSKQPCKMSLDLILMEVWSFIKFEGQSTNVFDKKQIFHCHFKR